MAVVCTRSNLCTSLIKSPVRSPMCPRDTVFFSPKLVQNILQKIHIDIDGSKNDPKGFVSNYGHSGWKKNCHSVAFNNVFFLRPVRFLLSWKKLSLTTSHWELDVLTLKISNINNLFSSDWLHPLVEWCRDFGVVASTERFLVAMPQPGEIHFNQYCHFC